MNIRKTLQQIFILFFLVNLSTGLFFKGVQELGIDPFVLLTGNLIVVVMTIISFYMLHSGLKSVSTTGFLSAVLGSFMLKLVIAVAIVFLYSRVSDGSMNMPSVMISMFLYLIYMFIELRGLLSSVYKK